MNDLSDQGQQNTPKGTTDHVASWNATKDQVLACLYFSNKYIAMFNIASEYYQNVDIGDKKKHCKRVKQFLVPTLCNMLQTMNKTIVNKWFPYLLPNMKVSKQGIFWGYQR